jgi:aquaporin Z
MATKKAAKKATTGVKPEAKLTKTTETKVKTVKSTKNDFVNEITKPTFLATLVAELIGTFLLAAGVIATSGQPLFVFFLLTAIVLMIGNISSAHVNPLVTVGAWATRRITTVKAVGYIIAQVLGSMLAFVVLSAFVNQAPEVSQEMQAYGQQAASLFTASPIPEGKELTVLFAELIGSTIFAFTVATVTSDKKKSETSTAFGVGGGLFIAALVAGSAAAVVSASAVINPAVAIALQAFSVEGTSTVWAIAIYIGAALIGGIGGFALSSIVEKAREK